MCVIVVVHTHSDLDLLALTGVEDKLQHNVRGTLETLRNAVCDYFFRWRVFLSSFETTYTGNKDLDVDRRQIGNRNHNRTKVTHKYRSFDVSRATRDN